MADEKAEWHLVRGREQAGPYPLSKMREAIAQNMLKPDGYVWRHGWPEWKRAGSVPELFPVEPPPAPPPPAIPETPPVVSPAVVEATQAEPSGPTPTAQSPQQPEPAAPAATAPEVPQPDTTSQPETSVTAQAKAPRIEASQVTAAPVEAPQVEVPQIEVPQPAPAAVALPRKPPNYIIDHWRGDLSLPKSFWLNGVLVTLAVQVFGLPLGAALEPIVRKIEGGEGSISQFAASLVVGAIMLTIWFAVTVWQCVGIWRSASKHGSRGGNRFWSFLVKLLVILEVLLILLGLVSAGIVIAAATLT